MRERDRGSDRYQDLFKNYFNPGDVLGQVNVRTKHDTIHLNEVTYEDVVDMLVWYDRSNTPLYPFERDNNMLRYEKGITILVRDEIVGFDWYGALKH